MPLAPHDHQRQQRDHGDRGGGHFGLVEAVRAEVDLLEESRWRQLILLAEQDRSRRLGGLTHRVGYRGKRGGRCCRLRL